MLSDKLGLQYGDALQALDVRLIVDVCLVPSTIAAIVGRTSHIESQGRR